VSGGAENTGTAWVSLGGNQGPTAERFRDALRHLASLDIAHPVAVSSLYRTAPWGDTAQPDFLNAVARMETRHSPDSLLAALLETEARHGRDRGRERRWGPRALDLDLLLMDDLCLDRPGLRLPHPRLHQRAFVLVPLAELDANLRIPGRGSVRDCLALLDPAGIERLAGPEWVAG
jgi:2-amino-4-hydroxy-6-hydroxymethyldihydropteridine diphosphokinase